MASKSINQAAEIKKLWAALRWALSNGIKTHVNDADAAKIISVMDRGCGCCSYEIEIPSAHYDAIVEATLMHAKNEARRCARTSTSDSGAK